ncbi:hypothetical protein AMECASPLE_005442 [Ameca splendens]|uniref:Uncharacterized protein n=1 Tax=Ameca splendens TaxID=208324 RepID=A0ABV0YLJ8_9TELE
MHSILGRGSFLLLRCLESPGFFNGPFSLMSLEAPASLPVRHLGSVSLHGSSQHCILSGPWISMKSPPDKAMYLKKIVVIDKVDPYVHMYVGLFIANPDDWTHISHNEGRVCFKTL